MTITNFIRFNHLQDDIFGGVTTAIVPLTLVLTCDGASGVGALRGLRRFVAAFCQPRLAVPNVDL